MDRKKEALSISIWILWIGLSLSGCGTYHKTLKTSDSTVAKKNDIVQDETKFSHSDSLESALFLSGVRYELKPGAIFSGSFDDRERWLLNNSKTIIIYQGHQTTREVKKDTLSSQVKKDKSQIKTNVKKKQLQRTADTTFKLPWYWPGIVGAVAIFYILIKNKKL